MKENTVAIHNGLRTEIAENFMNSLKDLFTESYISVPDSKVDLVDELSGTVSDLEEKLKEYQNVTVKGVRYIELSEDNYSMKDLDGNDLSTDGYDHIFVDEYFEDLS